MLQESFQELGLPEDIAALLAPEGDACNIQLDAKAVTAVRTAQLHACVQRSMHHSSRMEPVHSRPPTLPPADRRD
jgi:hypothetical protein